MPQALTHESIHIQFLHGGGGYTHTIFTWVRGVFISTPAPENAIIKAYELEIEPSGCLHWKLKSSKTVIITKKSTKSSGNLLLYGIYSVKMF